MLAGVWKIMMPYGITGLQSFIWFALQLVPCMLGSPESCMQMYNVQFSHTSLVFVSECNSVSTCCLVSASPDGSTTTV